MQGLRLRAIRPFLAFAPIGRQLVKPGLQRRRQLPHGQWLASVRVGYRGARNCGDHPFTVAPQAQVVEVAARSLDHHVAPLGNVQPVRSLLVVAQIRIQRFQFHQLARRRFQLDRRHDRYFGIARAVRIGEQVDLVLSCIEE